MFLLSMACPISIAVDEIPPSPSPSWGQQVNLRAFLRWHPHTLLTEIKGQGGGRQQDSRSFKLGHRWRLHPNLQMGPAYMRMYGARHNEDWFWSSGNWQWADSEKRGENLWLWEIIPRVALPFLPGKHWTGELQVTYMLNTSWGDQQTLKLRPGLRTFVFPHANSLLPPQLSFFFYGEFYRALNFGDRSLYEWWLHLGFLHHVSPQWEWGAFIGRQEHRWVASGDFQRRTLQNYKMKQTTHLMGLSLNLHFDFPAL